MNKISQIANEIAGWLFIFIAFMFTFQVFTMIAEEQPAIVAGGTASVAILFAVLGFGFLFLRRIEDIKYNSRTSESDEYAQQLAKEEEQKKQRNWIVIGIAIGVIGSHKDNPVIRRGRTNGRLFEVNFAMKGTTHENSRSLCESIRTKAVGNKHRYTNRGHTKVCERRRH